MRRMRDNRENTPPLRHSMTTTTEGMSSYHHGAPVKQDSERTSSPVVLQSSSLPEYASSPVATSQSSTSSPLSSDHRYNHHPHHYMAPPSRPNPAAAASMSQSVVPVPVRSASWAAGSQEHPDSTVPTVITTKAGSTPNFAAASSAAAPTISSSSSTKSLNTTTKSNKTLQVPAKKKHAAKTEKKNGDTVTARRQKRLERNRESARLSRRRRKQYLEVLEDRVKQLSIEMDSGRRQHAAAAIDTICKKRQEVLNMGPSEQSLGALDGALSRTSHELSVLATFNTQQLKSFSLPADSKFVLWLTLQGDTFFRGGRAASERLSAARIGERMLHSGNDRVAPINPMWPLFCNEVGLSYDQEERVRNYQRTLLQEASSWLERHTARASALAMQSFHDSLKTVAYATKSRENSTKPILSASQRLRFLAWAEKNADRIKTKFVHNRQQLGRPKETDKFQFSKEQHVSANLYILNDRLQKVLSSFSQSYEEVPPAALKRLSRRPSFESLGQQKEESNRALSRDGSFASSGSLKRSASSLSMEEEDKPQPQQVSPEDGEEAASSLIEKELGFVKDIIPKHVPPVAPPAPAAPVAVTSTPAAPMYHYAPPPIAAPMPTPMTQSHSGHATVHPTPIAAHPRTAPTAIHVQPVPAPHENYIQPAVHYAPAYSHPQHHQYYQHYPGQPQGYPNSQPMHHYHHTQPQTLAPAPTPMVTTQPTSSLQPALQPAQQAPQPAPVPNPAHQRKSSFLPPHLNVVPEEMFPSTDGAEDFFMSLMDDEDWAIGEGVDMDTSNT